MIKIKSIIKKIRKTRKIVIISSLIIIIILTPLVAYSLLNTTENTVKADCFFKFDEGYGTTINDENGNVSGTITGATWKQEDLCVGAKCLYFDGSADYIDFGDDDNLDFAQTDDFTISLWFRHTLITKYSEVLIAKTNSSAGYKIYMESDGDLTFAIDDDFSWTPDKYVTSSAATYDDDQWHHLEAVKDGTTGIYLYIDGQLVSSNESISSIGTLVNSANFYIGIDGDGVSSPFQGFIDEVKVYASARTAAEVKTDFLGVSPSRGTTAKFGPDQKILSSGLVGYWNMDNRFTDQSGNSNGLLNVGVATTSGKFSTGAEFVSTNSEFLYNSTEKFNNIRTVSFWTNPDATTNYFFSLDDASIQASSGIITTTGMDNAKIFVNGEESTTLTADTWQHITVTTDSLFNSYSTGVHNPPPYNNSGIFRTTDIYCITEDNCKLAFTSIYDTALRFMDCDDSRCTSGTVSILDGATSCVLTGGDGCDSSRNLVNSSDVILSLYCPTSDNCKISYYNTSNSALMFADCDDEYCSTGSIEILDGMAGCGLTGCSESTSAGIYSSLYCPTSDNCKISYYDATNTALMFADCYDETCSSSSGTTEVVDGNTGCGLTGCSESTSAGTYSSLFCPASDDCKISYYDATNTALVFADCYDESCSSSSGTVEIVDGNTDCGLTGCSESASTGTYTSLDCPSATDCKISYINSDSDLYLADCDDATCSLGTTTLLEGASGCPLTNCNTGRHVDKTDISCPATDDCKILYTDGSYFGSFFFADCNNSTCSSGTIKNIAHESDCSLRGGDGCRVYGRGSYSNNLALSCPSSTNCKPIYIDDAYYSLNFGDCDDASCSTGSVELIDGGDANVGNYYDMYCPTPDNCKLAFYNESDNAVHFMDCDDSTCTTGRESVLDGSDHCVLTGGDGCSSYGMFDHEVSIYCPTSDDCKVTYYKNDLSALMFADCDDEYCSSGSVEIVDGYTGCGLTGGDGCTTSLAAGRGSSVYCPTASDCKIVYYDQTNTAMRFADCGDATCSSGSVEVLDGTTDCGLSGGDGCDTSIALTINENALYCPTATDCKIAYYDSTNSAVKFADCGDATCSSGSVEIIDGMVSCGLTNGDGCNTGIDAKTPSLYCPAADDCKISYRDETNSALLFADCGNATCSSGTIEILNGNTGCGITGCSTSSDTGDYSSLYCPTADDCKIVDYQYPSVLFYDCSDATCTGGTYNILDGNASCTLSGGEGCGEVISGSAGLRSNQIYCSSASSCQVLYNRSRSVAFSRLMLGLCSDATCSSGSTGYAYTGSPTTIQVGKVGSNYYDGTMDEIRVYNRALSPAEVQDLYEWAPGPVLYWKFDEAAGQYAYDSSGNGNNSSAFSGDTGWVNGKFGGATTYDGDDDAVTTTANLNYPKTVSVEAWIKRTSTPVSGGIIISQYGGSTGWGSGYMILVGNTNKVQFAVNTDDVDDNYELYTSDVSGPYIDTNWHHVAGTYDGTTAKIYFNGVLTTTTTGVNADIFYRYSDNVRVGNRVLGAAVHNDFPGLIDDVRIYNYARTQEQIIQDMNAGHPAPGSPVGSAYVHWKFDEGALNTCSGGTNDYCDSTPDPHNLAFSTTSGGFTNSGKFGKAYNGTTDVWASHDDTGNYFDFSETQDFTFSLWFKSDVNSAPANTEYLFNKSYQGVIQRAGYAMYANTSGHICFAIDDDSTWDPDVSTCNSTNLYDQQWHHIVGVRDVNADLLKLFVDGIEKSSSTDTTTATLANDRYFILADRDAATTGSDELNGDLDEVKIYRLAMTAEQVKTEYNAGFASVWGSTGTSSTGTADSSSAREYCVPGDTSTCDAPVAEWKFDENTGSYAYDTSGDGNTGQLGTAAVGDQYEPRWTPGKYSSALNFDGSDDYVEIGSSSKVDNSSQGTIEAWVKLLRNDVDQTIFSYGGGAAGGAGGLSLGFGWSGSWTDQLSFEQRTDGGSVYSLVANKTDFSNNTWYHIAMVSDSSTWKLYVNGKEETYEWSDNNGNWFADTSVIETDHTVIGRKFTNGSFSEALQGQIDAVKVYNYARTPAQIAWEYNRGGPVGWWKLDENQTGNGQTVYDSSGNGNNGTTEGGTGNLDCTVAGKRNTACDFDGSDDGVVISTPTNLSITVAITVEAWIKPNNVTGQRQIISKSSGGSVNQRAYYLRVEDDSTVFSIIQSGVEHQIWGSVANGEWQHIVGTYDGSNQKLYRNGTLQSSEARTGAIDAETGSVYIGSLFSSSEFFSGSIDEVKIFNYALTPLQIEREFNQGAVHFGP